MVGEATQFEVSGHTYRARKPDARVQLHISRKLMPFLPSFKEVLEVLDDEGRVDVKDLGKLKPFADAIAQMPKEDVDYIIDECMKVTDRANLSEGGEIQSWTPLWNRQARAAQFQDLNMIDLIHVVRNVIGNALEDFFTMLPSRSKTE